MEYPKVCIEIRDGERVETVRPSYQIPNVGAFSPWREVELIGSSTKLLQWSFNKSHPHMDLFVNGIFVETIHYQGFRRAFGSDLRAPAVNVLDSRGYFPLLVTRDGLTGEFPHKQELVRDLLFDHVAWMFSQASMSFDKLSPKGAAGWSRTEDYSFGGDAYLEDSAYAVCSEGLLPLTSWHLKNAEVSRMACVLSWGTYSSVADAGILHRCLETPTYFRHFALYGGFHASRQQVLTAHYLSPSKTSLYGTEGWSFFLSTDQLKAFDPDGVVLKTHDQTIEEAGNGFARIRAGQPGEPNAALEHDFAKAVQEGNALGRSSLIGLMQIDIKPLEEPPAHDGPFEEVWSELQLPPIIPFDDDERRSLLAGPCGRLVPYVERHARGWGGSEEVK